MTNTSKLALTILLVSLTLGLLGDALLRATPWGLNAALWIAALGLGLLAIVNVQRVPLTGGGRWLLIPAAIFAAGFAWRDSFTLQACYFLAVLMALALVAYRALRGRVRVAGFIDYFGALVMAGVNAVFGVFSLVFGDIQWQGFIVGRQRTRQIVGLSTGLLIALPLVLVFGSLLTAADAAFDQIVRHLFDWDIDQIVSHAITIGAWSWLVAGFLRQTLLSKETPVATSSRGLSLGSVEIGTALGALNVLFFAFVVVQFRYFFGGAETIRTITTLTYAEYARRGFFELVNVAALVLPLLLLAHHLLRKNTPAAIRLYNIMAGTMIALLFVIMASALLRMKLYTDEFGLTELRLYTTAFMFWLALVFVWFIGTVLYGQANRFMFGALLAGFAVLIGLSAINPDEVIVRTNVSRVNTPNSFDSYYVLNLSADAVPALITALPVIPEEQRCGVAAYLLDRYSPPERPDWLTWNWSRSQAWQVVTANQAYLKSIACPQHRD